MQSRHRMRYNDEYEQDDYDEYEEDASDEEEDEEKEEPISQEQQEFLKLRQQLKEKFRKAYKNESAGHFGLRGQLQDKKRTATNDNFGSFFGPSKPVIASRVLEERRSMLETQHITSRIPNASSGNAKDPAYRSSEKRAIVHKQQPKFVNEVKKKAQTLKDMRDYSFLLSDDADLPAVKEEQQPMRNVSVPNSAQGPKKSKLQVANPSRPISNGHGQKNPPAKNPQSQTRVGPEKGAALKPRPATTELRRIDNARSGSGRPVGYKTPPSRVPSLMVKHSVQSAGTSKPPVKLMKDLSLNKKLSSAEPRLPAQRNHYSDQRRPSQSLNNVKSMPNKPPVSSKSQPPKPRDSYEDNRKKMPRKLDDDDDEDAIRMIRDMFRYNPNKYADDDDDSDMEAGFNDIQKEERRSAKIARKEDEEQARLIEEEERRERMRKKQKLKR